MRFSFTLIYDDGAFEDTEAVEAETRDEAWTELVKRLENAGRVGNEGRLTDVEITL